MTISFPRCLEEHNDEREVTDFEKVFRSPESVLQGIALQAPSAPPQMGRRNLHGQVGGVGSGGRHTARVLPAVREGRPTGAHCGRQGHPQRVGAVRDRSGDQSGGVGRLPRPDLVG